MKTFASLAAAAVMLIGSILPIVVCASSSEKEDILSDAAAAILICPETGDVISEKNADEPIEAAGLVRLPALLTICKAFDSGEISEDTVVTVTSASSSIKGTTAFLSPNEHIPAGELLKASVMLLPGDAVSALLYALYSNESTALSAVKTRLEEIATDPAITSPLGAGTMFSVRELASVCIELARCESFKKYSSIYTDILHHENAADTELTNPNRLVRFYSGCYGLATGSVGSSQYSGAFIAKRGNTSFLAVIAGAKDSASRFRCASALLDSGFAGYRLAQLNDQSGAEGYVKVNFGSSAAVRFRAVGSCEALMPVSDARIISELELPESLDAPVYYGQEIGRLYLKNASGEILAKIPLAAAEEVRRLTFGDCIMMMLFGWLRI